MTPPLALAPAMADALAETIDVVVYEDDAPWPGRSGARTSRSGLASIVDASPARTTGNGSTSERTATAYAIPRTPTSGLR